MKCGSCEKEIKGNGLHYDEVSKDKSFCDMICVNAFAYTQLTNKIKPFRAIRTRTFIFPKNHSKFIYSIISNYDKQTSTGKTFTNQFYCQSHYIMPEEENVREFTDEESQADYHQKLANHYLKVANEQDR